MVIKEITYNSDDDFADYTYKVELDKNVYFAYLFEKEFNTEFEDAKCLIDSEWKDFYNKFETDWFSNKVDERAISESDDFNSFLKNYYLEEASSKYDTEMEDLDPDDWWQDLDDDQKQDIMERERCI